MHGPYERFGKRALDVTCAAVALIITSPVWLAVSVAIRLDDGGPVVFTQERVGRNERLFRIHKFRTMPTGTPHLPSALAEQLRITRVGRVLRRTNLDELPQLLNVLAGSMSLVGPRPPLPSQVALIELRRVKGATRVLPGVTGLAQVSGFDGMPDDVKSDYDALYARSISLAKDVSILARTVAYVFRPPPTY